MHSAVEVLGEVQERYIYPVKGLAGALVPSEVALPIDEYGVQGSRRWVIIDDEGQAISARDPRRKEMLGIKTTPIFGTDSFIINDEVQIDPVEDGASYELEIFKDIMVGSESEKASRWINERLGTDCLHVVHFIADAGRTIHPEKEWKGSAPRAFVDDAPIHIVNRATMLDAQNRWSGFDADPRRFRPDIVVSIQPRRETELGGRDLRIGNVVLENIRPMERCAVPGINPDTFERTKVIARMLDSEFRMQTPQGPQLLPCFGVALNVEQPGTIDAHDAVELLGS